MKIELHIIQNFAPSCLNRDETNSPKDCDFGGVRRARISSQCIKRAVRTSQEFTGHLQGHTAVRTRFLYQILEGKLIESGINQEKVAKVLPTVLQKFCGFKDGKTSVLLYLGDDEMDKMAKVLVENWETFADLPEDQPGKKSKGKSEPVMAFLKEISATTDRKTKAVDVALFGRMVADKPDLNIDAACQVAHAISTHRINMEMDFFTAVDDLLPAGDTGAGMMGTIEYNSACFYRYSLLDVTQLEKNLGGEKELTKKAVQAYIEAFIKAIPSARQNSMAAQNLPSFVMAVAREEGSPSSLANAFEEPVFPQIATQGGLVTQSIKRLDAYWGRLVRMYGEKGVICRPVCVLDDVDELSHLGDQRLDSVDDLVQEIGAVLP